MKKISKKMIIALVAILIISGSGIAFYANNKVKETQNAYYSVKLESFNTTQYNTDEKKTYDELVLEREDAFNNLDVEKLTLIAENIKELDGKVLVRVEKEALEKVKKQIEAIKLPKGANDEEKKSFEKMKKEALEKFKDEAHTSIDAEKDKKQLDGEIKKIKKAVAKRKKEAEEAAQSYNESNSYNYSDYDYDSNYDDGYDSGYDSGYDGGYGGSGSSDGGSSGTADGGSSEECYTNADGSQTCYGGDW